MWCRSPGGHRLTLTTESRRRPGARSAAPTQGICGHVGLTATDRRADAAPGKHRARAPKSSGWLRTGVLGGITALVLGLAQYSFPGLVSADTPASVAPSAV